MHNFFALILCGMTDCVGNCAEKPLLRVRALLGAFCSHFFVDEHILKQLLCLCVLLFSRINSKIYIQESRMGRGYEEYVEAHPEKKVILMGDSAGGGLSLALAEQIKLEGIRMPDELILLSPWVDATMENPDVEQYAEEDPWLSVPWLRVCGRRWAGDEDPHSYQASPINGDLEDLHHVTVFSGTKEVFYPDLMKFFDQIKQDSTNELIVGKDMMHVYPLMPIPEAKPACDVIFRKIMR